MSNEKPKISPRPESIGSTQLSKKANLSEESKVYEMIGVGK